MKKSKAISRARNLSILKSRDAAMKTYLKLQIRKLQAENRRLQKRNEELEAEVARLKKPPTFLDEALNSGDGTYKP